jgi:hypothetical protein
MQQHEEKKLEAPVELTAEQLKAVSGGEVGATGRGDDYSYTGQISKAEAFRIVF